MDDRKQKADQQLIMDLGGPTAVAKKLKFGKGGAQRVQNWMTRGIPAKVKLERPDLFLPQLVNERDPLVESPVEQLLQLPAATSSRHDALAGGAPCQESSTSLEAMHA